MQRIACESAPNRDLAPARVTTLIRRPRIQSQGVAIGADGDSTNTLKISIGSMWHSNREGGPGSVLIHKRRRPRSTSPACREHRARSHHGKLLSQLLIRITLAGCVATPPHLERGEAVSDRLPPQADRRFESGSLALDRPHLQCQPTDDFKAPPRGESEGRASASPHLKKTAARPADTEGGGLRLYHLGVGR